MDQKDLQNGLSMRPARPLDGPFLASLFQSARSELSLIDGEREFVETIIKEQHRFQIQGYGESYPNALNYIIEKLGDPIGKVSVDFGHNEVHILEISFIPAAQGRGYGTTILQGLQRAAAQVAAPLTLSVRKDNLKAQQLYRSLGFVVDQQTSISDLMIWYPTRDYGLKTQNSR